MVSDFLVVHPNSPFFSLTEDEWKLAVETYPSLLEYSGINYEPRTCTGSIIPGQNGYFDSETLLSQFERLFQMLEFKKKYNIPIKHDIEVLVDNARTHTALTINIDNLRYIKTNETLCS